MASSSVRTRYRKDDSLLSAVRACNKDRVEKLLKEGVNPNDGKSLLVAFKCGDVTIFYLLITHPNINLFIKDDDDMGILHYIAMNGKYIISDEDETYQLNLINHVLSKGVNINDISKNGTALDIAMKNGNYLIASMLIQHKCIFNDQHILASLNDDVASSSLFREMLAQTKLGHPLDDQFIWTLLMTIAKNGLVDHLYQLIILYHANVKRIVNRFDINRMTALHYASLDNNVEMVELLLKFGANKDLKRIDDKKPIDLATEGDVRVLLAPEDLNKIEYDSDY